MERIGRDMDDLRKKMETFIKNNGRLNEQNPKTEAEEAAEERKKWTNRLYKAGIGRRYHACTFQNIERKGLPDSKLLKSHYAIAKDYAKNFKVHKAKGQGLIFAGPVGRMKTTMAVAIAQEIMKDYNRAYFITMPELMDSLLQNNLSQEVRTQTKETDLLILDDMGAEYQNDWVLNAVDAIISKRYNELLPVIITTNKTPEEMNQRYMSRIFDRLKHANRLLIEAGESLRKNEV